MNVVIVHCCQVNWTDSLTHRFPFLYPSVSFYFALAFANQDLENYEALVDVRCYELVGLFLCSLFVPRCGISGISVPPCRSLCYGKSTHLNSGPFPTLTKNPSAAWPCSYSHRDDAAVRLLFRRLQPGPAGLSQVQLIYRVRRSGRVRRPLRGYWSEAQREESNLHWVPVRPASVHTRWLAVRWPRWLPGPNGRVPVRQVRQRDDLLRRREVHEPEACLRWCRWLPVRTGREELQWVNRHIPSLRYMPGIQGMASG